MKKFILYITVCVLVSSCAARKVKVDKVDSVVKTDSVVVTKQELVVTQDNNVSVVTDTDELEISPVSDTIPMVVNGITYKNVKLRYKKTKKVLVDETKIKVSEKVLIKANVKKAVEIKTFKKDIDKKANYTIYFWWLLILLLIALGIYAYKRINRTLF